MESLQPQRKKFKTTQDWNNFIVPILQSGRGITGNQLLDLRRGCYVEIEKLRGRPLLVYATKFLDSMPPGVPNQIDLSDVDGFTDLINSVDKSSSVDVLLHSPGGRPDATERLVGILRNKFQEVHFLIPHSAYSAATMFALSGNSIVLHPSATLGPIDPQVGVSTKEGLIRFVPAKSILNGFGKAKAIIKQEGPEALPAYIPLIEKYSLDLFELCEDSEKLSKELVSSWLAKYMFAGQRNTGRRIKRAVSYFSDYNTHKLHSRPLSMHKLSDFGLKIELAGDKLSDLLWEAYILLNGFFNVSPFVKLYESTYGVSWGKQFQIIVGQPQVQQQLKPKPQTT
ncbi:MAG: hypothetical protein Q8R11_01710 [bacterium]|nr:hypothetical protein [bacterium]